ncbi:MAG: hypothetical protein JXQ73_33285 [Phycisphaerae bacterium]|nr:hypothetical protein [Phycisphaerae bacterium]
MMILECSALDDPDFIREVEHMVDGVVETLRPERVFVVTVDNWFGERWLRFTCKWNGLVGVRRKTTTMPPFHPKRILSERCFVRDGDAAEYEERALPKPLHVKQHSEDNFWRNMNKQAGDSVFVWYSGNTAKNGRGCLMVYDTDQKSSSEWYLSLLKKGVWKIEKHVGISHADLAVLRGRQPVA